MQSSAKYLIHATVRTSGVVERSDVVGAIFGQTEGLLGEDLDLRELQESSKLGRIDVDIDSEGGRSVGQVTISSGLDRVETAVLAAALETMDRVGPCRAECTVTSIEDARAAKRRELVERATELLTDLEDATVTSDEIVQEVRKQARVEEITEYRGFPAGPRVATSDAIIVVEGRADVRRLLKYGIRNAVAVEGTDIPTEITELTRDRNTTAFLDGDRGGDLILRELQQVGNVDYVAFAPTDQSVEDLDRTAIQSALRRKVPIEQVTDGQTAREVFGPTATEPTVAEEAQTDGEAVPDGSPAESVVSADAESHEQTEEPETPVEDEPSPDTETTQTETTDDAEPQAPETLAGHVDAVIGSETRTARFLDQTFNTIAETDVEDAFESLDTADPVPAVIVIDGPLTQRLLDLAAQRGVGQIVTTETGEFVKQPTDVRVREAAELKTGV
ncbi:DNA primase DnaG [Halovenus salina]|uniref:DNA primase DnaG n=1 Tax=Halovenus salina TaxID=1510225 RepID=UPI002260E933|nr:DNA primase DnaG [Halovenus salina]